MTVISAKIPNIKRLESRLERVENEHQRLEVLTQLLDYYSFTDIKKARRVLEEYIDVQHRLASPEVQLHLYLYTAFIENQAYNFVLSEMNYREALGMIEDYMDVQQQTEVLIDYAATCLNLDLRQNVLDLLERARKMLKNSPNNLLLARLICREGFLNLHAANYADAIERFLEAERMLTNETELPLKLKDYYTMSLINSGLGRVYRQIDDKQKSVRAHLDVVRICEALGMRTRLSWHYNNVGESYMVLNEPEKAEEFFRKALKITDDISQQARAGAYANLGKLSFQQHKEEEGLTLFRRAEALYLERLPEPDYENLAQIEYWRAEFFRIDGKTRRSSKHYAKALEYAMENKKKNYRQIAIFFKSIASFYADLEDFKNAYEYELLYQEAYERYMEEFKEQRISEIEIKYETERKKKETEILRLQAAELQMKALRAQMNPHFMFNALNAIQQYITSKSERDNDLAAQYLAKFSQLMRKSLDYSDMEYISLDREIEFVEQYLYINQKLRFHNNLRYEIIVAEELEEDIMGVPTMIVQPYVENAIEHGVRMKSNGFIKLHFSLYDENNILCIVEDNGIGREKARLIKQQRQTLENHRSKGTMITEKRLQLLHEAKKQQNNIWVKIIDLKDEATAEPLGTRVEILIPIVDDVNLNIQ